MHRFYVDSTGSFLEPGSLVYIYGSDVNHIKNVLRMRTGDVIAACSEGYDYICRIKSYEEKAVLLVVLDGEESKTELPVKLTIYQGLPKKDKMELIIQKSVELGACCIVPVITKHTVIKLKDEKKDEKKHERWQAIAESAAKQSKRGIIPRIERSMTFDEALIHAKNKELILIPYENADDMNKTRTLIKKAAQLSSVGIFIGPEGGFDERELHMAEEYGACAITLGKRILRTETAAFVTLSYINYEID